MKIVCKDCGKEFELSGGEIGFYKSKGLDLPKRCGECRAKKKNGGNGAKAPQSGSSAKKPSADGQPSGKTHGVDLKKILGVAALIVVCIVGIITALGRGADENEPKVTQYEQDTAAQDEQLSLNTPAADETQDADGTDIFAEENYTGGGTSSSATVVTEYYFRNEKLLEQHYEKHGREMGFASPEEYEAAASAVISDPDALTKTEKEDGDLVYYLEETNEFVILSTDGYIRTYFEPSGGLDYFNRQ